LKIIEKLIKNSQIVEEDKIKCIADIRTHIECAKHIYSELVKCGIDELEAKKILPGLEIE